MNEFVWHIKLGHYYYRKVNGCNIFYPFRIIEPIRWKICYTIQEALTVFSHGQW